MEKIFDSHAHYNNAAFTEDYPQVMAHLQSSGIGYIMNCGADLRTSKQALLQSQAHDFMWCSVGIHPLDVKEAENTHLQEIKDLAQNPKVKAIGEIGLDYHYPDSATPDQQKDFFKAQLDMAVALNLPVIIHSREATQDTIEMLKPYAHRLAGVIHCFSGSAESCKVFLDMGFYIGFTGVVTFKNARRALEALKVVPLNRLLIETDCPYMAPEPHRGKRCDSAHLHFIAEKIALEKGISKQEVIDFTTENAKRLFHII